MTQMNAPLGRPAARPRMNVYTVLLVIALLAVLVGIAYLWYRNNQLFPDTQPWEIGQPPRTAAAGPAANASAFT